jgi:hypothetical protein
MRALRIQIRIPNTGFDNTDAAEEGRRWQEAELRRKDEIFAAAEEKHRRQVQILPASKPLRTRHINNRYFNSYYVPEAHIMYFR